MTTQQLDDDDGDDDDGDDDDDDGDDDDDVGLNVLGYQQLAGIKNVVRQLLGVCVLHFGINICVVVVVINECVPGNRQQQNIFFRERQTSKLI